MIRFDCDYMAGAHPEIMGRLAETNLQQTSGYGLDEYTRNAERLILKACGLENGRVFLLTGGTQTNSVVIDGLLTHCEGVIAADTSHINVHECGAIESCGHKVLTLPNHEGKLDADEISGYIERFYSDDTFRHMVFPGMVYISHPTELGTLYTLQELEKIGMVCRRHNIPLYLDGARLAYALASAFTDVSLTDIARICDVFYIGGTKCGALFGEAVVISNPKLLKNFFSLIKQHGALFAKGRLLGIQFETLFSNNLYTRIGRHGVDMAMQLKGKFVAKDFRQFVDSPTNQQFFILRNDIISILKRDVSFSLWESSGTTETTVRFVTDWATDQSSINILGDILASCSHGF